MREAEPSKAYLAVVEIGPLALGEVGAVYPEIDHDTTCAGQFLGRRQHIWRRADNHRNQRWERHGRDYRVIARSDSVSEMKFLLRRIDLHELMAQVDLRLFWQWA